MTENNIVALQPYVVALDVAVEVPLVNMEVTLCFGPFDSLAAADEWRDRLEKEHDLIEIAEAVENADPFAQEEFPERQFLRAHVQGADVFQVEGRMRARGELIPPKTPVEDAHRIHVYALYALQEAVTAAFSFLNDDPVSA
ncbi:MAG: hypothetical protein A2942_04900 [Candidatus Lloydbacteria bacterium RIFCSPLOWO2_01_FULL_50_20]|uniref:Uncharacterized protein n=1 Tax=Candidatus Lloydbacteria bacterium RIFCSPLOWO2_01_FULL_50_20 TaxID=1798665 RepID=A0A1G2DDI4_9BACT|nr:MAG: hypothetical protein A3C13_02385 [Candidatus Lloydbacteria bacterium RIFCSPHIGHO2_02_FULL_50_11]OGZ11707.1 MAG: hypothetical protein A2942_04900 [Candidatus Lloydbacteria bacterium RIFCSPLOWO2_01_FULL_50_20]